MLTLKEYSETTGRTLRMNELNHDQAKNLIRIGGTVAILIGTNPNPIILTARTDGEKRIKRYALMHQKTRYFAYGVQLNKKEEWATQYTAWEPNP